MKICNILTLMLMLGLLVIVGCSDDEMQNDLNNQSDKSELVSDSDFNKTYINYTESLGLVRRSLRSAGGEGFDNTAVRNYFSEVNNGQQLKQAMDYAYAKVNGKDLLEIWEVLKDEGTINTAQHDYLRTYSKELRKSHDSGHETGRMVLLTQDYFETKTLKEYFQDNEIAVLQFLGVAITNSMIEAGENNGLTLKTCDRWWQKIACGIAAAAAVALAATIVISTGLWAQLDKVCDILEALGVDLLDIPQVLTGAATGVNALFDTAIPVGQIACAIALTVGIVEYVYQFCCDNLFGCDSEDDPCCDVNCPPGTRCDNGNCIDIPDPCENVVCGEDEYCRNGYCHPMNTCDDDRDCPPGEQCWYGSCQPL